MTTHKHTSNAVNGMSSTYKSWSAMVQRCTNSNNPDWLRYGGRGITLDARWLLFAEFLLDMGEKPHEKLTIDRINNDGNYCKDNCRWASQTTQAWNRGTRKDSPFGIKGVGMRTDGKFRVRVNDSQIYCGNDFFEACCVRKSWENRT